MISNDGVIEACAWLSAAHLPIMIKVSARPLLTLLLLTAEIDKVAVLPWTNSFSRSSTAIIHGGPTSRKTYNP